MHFYRSLLKTFILIFSCISFVSSVFAETPIQTLKRTHAKIEKLLKQKTTKGSSADKKNRADIKKVVNTLLDFTELAKLSLGKHWQARSEKEHVEFVGILQDLIERNYSKQLKTNLGYTLEYRDEKVTGEKAAVSTAIKVKKNGRITEILIGYKLRNVGGNWMVFDVITDEVSIVNNYRSQFNRIIRKESYEALVKKMRRKLEETS